MHRNLDFGKVGQPMRPDGAAHGFGREAHPRHELQDSIDYFAHASGMRRPTVSGQGIQ